MISDRISDELSKQMNAELSSAYFYLSMVSFFRFLKLDGFAKVMKQHINLEFKHAQAIHDFMIENDLLPRFQDIKAKEMKFKSMHDALKHAIRHEKMFTKQINELIEVCVEENCQEVISFLTGLVGAQVKEEKHLESFLKKVNTIQNGNVLFKVDKRFRTR